MFKKFFSAENYKSFNEFNYENGLFLNCHLNKRSIMLKTPSDKLLQFSVILSTFCKITNCMAD